ncbi:MAG: stage III sporulation protein AF [Desulfitobacteriaceae bacterium]
MATLQTLVRNLAVILLLATFLEMLLPSKSMRGYVRLVMGLFVISAVLSPIANFLHTPLSLEIPAWTMTSSQDLPVLAADSPGTRLGQNAVAKQYRQILGHQIEALALGVKGVEGASVEIAFEDNGNGLIEQPRIATVNITLAPGKGTVQSVQPIIIGESTNSKSASTLSVAEEVREKVSKLMEIPLERVYVKTLGS